MAEYIKREDVQNMLDIAQIITDAEVEHFGYCTEDVDINSIPAADVRENVRGSWIWDDDGYDWGIGAYICSNCKSRPGTWWDINRDKNPLLCSGGSFCGNCGADMRGESDE